jgi:hypothetical protein
MADPKPLSYHLSSFKIPLLPILLNSNGCKTNGWRNHETWTIIQWRMKTLPFQLNSLMVKYNFGAG